MTIKSEARTGMPSSLRARLENIELTLKAKREDRALKLAEAGYDEEGLKQLAGESAAMQTDAIEHPLQNTGKRLTSRGRGATSTRIIEHAQLKLFEGEHRGDFRQFPVEPNSEYPSLLARVPVFVPGQRSKMAARLDKDLAMRFETSWGTGRKFGPPLTIYDEDTLLAILGLRQRQLVGMGNKMPIQVMNPFRPGEETNVQVVFTTIGEVQDYLRISKGGRGHKARLESVKRLAGVVIEFTRASEPALNAVIKEASFSTKLIDLVTQDLEAESCLYIQFPPVMVKWLSQSYTYIEMDVRRQLTDHGKAIHKFLASQQHFNIFVDKLRGITGSSLDPKDFMRSLRATMKKLEGMGWCEYEIEGNGRSVRHKLTGHRLKRKADPAQ